MNDIVLEKSSILGNQQITGKQLTNNVHVVTTLTEKIAERLGVRYAFFTREGVIRDGFVPSVGLDIKFDNCWFQHEIEKIGKLTLVGATILKMKVHRQGDGKKKSKKLMFTFVVSYVGAPLELEEYLMKVQRGSGVATLKLAQDAQVPMFEPEAKPAEPADAPHEPMDPTKLEYSVKGGWSANITVTAVADGFEVTRRANSPTKKLKQGPPAKFASEREALEEGALDINRWATKIGTSGTKPEKREAVKLIDWCYGISNRDGAANLLDSATGTAPQLVNPVQAAREYPD